MAEYEFIRLSESDRMARLTLARPPLNVLNMAMLADLNAALTSLAARTDLCALIIDGEGKVFCAGVDVPEHRRETVRDMLSTFHNTFRLLHRLPMPVVCAAHGGAYGGGMELAIFCDVVLASDNLKIGVPEITLGVFPPLAIAQLSRLVGVNRAAELIYTGAIVDGREAHRMGLVNHVYPADDFRSAVDRFVDQFRKLSAYSLSLTRRTLRRVACADFETALQTAENAYLDDLMAGHDPSEGLEAFIGKRKPVWKDQ